jgi:TPR repeat protein
MSSDPIHTRFDLLCRATRTESRPNALQPLLAALQKLLFEDLPALTAKAPSAPPQTVQLHRALEAEMQRLQDFCAFPALAHKNVVAFGGSFSAGKSTLINALLGKKVLVAQIDPTTAMATYVLAGEAAEGEMCRVHALNPHGQVFELDHEAFSSLTHDEPARHGTNINRLLKASYVTLPDFAWENLAFIDTPGYTKPEDQASAITDARIAQSQLDNARFIVWVIDGRQGCLTEEDAKFLSSINPSIPRLIVVSRADQKPADDIAAVVAGIKAALQAKGLPFIDVVAVSARKLDQYPLTAVLAQLKKWNTLQARLKFADNFNEHFKIYTLYLDQQQKALQKQVEALNLILSLGESSDVRQAAKDLFTHAKEQLEQLDATLQEFSGVMRNSLIALFEIGKELGVVIEVDPYELACAHCAGYGVVQDFSEAFDLFKRSAHGGNPEAQLVLAKLNENGRFAEDPIGDNYYFYSKSLKDAFFWLEKSAENGNSEAQWRLGDLYAKASEEGVFSSVARAVTSSDPDWSEESLTYPDCGKKINKSSDILEKFSQVAHYCYLKSAEGGNPEGQYKLASTYEFGEGVEQSLTLAEEWFRKSANNGNLEAIKKIETDFKPEPESLKISFGIGGVRFWF